MPRLNIFQWLLFDFSPFSDISATLRILWLAWNVIGDVLLQSLPRRRLPPVPPRLVGNTLLCSLCRAIFEVHMIAIDEWDFWRAYRHQDDIALLQLSADSGCQICTKLLVWINSIENDPWWLRLSQLPWNCTIRSQLWKTEVHNQFELLFTIYRFEPWGASYEDLFCRLRLRVIPAEGNLIVIHTPAYFSCLCLVITTNVTNRSWQS